MDLIGIRVVHKRFGIGKITELSGEYITIHFLQNGELKNFLYPAAFIKSLEVEDPSLSAQIQKDILEHMAEEEIKNKEAEYKLQQMQVARIERAGHNTKSSRSNRGNIAFKCNYCDGGKGEKRIGFAGVCSEETIDYNIKAAKHVWCGCEDSLCRKFLDGEVSGKDLRKIAESGFVCYESQMLVDWRAYAGIVQTGKNKGNPMKLNDVRCNSLAVLTTRFPNETDDTRFIFAVFLVDENYEGDAKEEGFVGANEKYRIELNRYEATELKFWDYYFNPNKPEKIIFGSGLHRYLTDVQSAQILSKIVELKVGTSREEHARGFLEYYCTLKGLDSKNIPKANGALKR